MMPEKVKVRRAIPEKENDFDDDNSEEETKKVRKRKKKVPGQKRVTGININIFEYSPLLRIFTVAFLLSLAPAGGSNPAGQSANLI